MDYEQWFWGVDGDDLGAEGPFPELQPPPQRVAGATGDGPAAATPGLAAAVAIPSPSALPPPVRSESSAARAVPEPRTRALVPALVRLRRTQVAAAMACALVGLIGLQVLRHSGVGSQPGFLSAGSIVDNGADLALERAAAVNIAPASVDTAPKPPGRLIIPSIGVDAQILPVGVNSQGEMSVTNESYDVGWYDKGPAPGDPGDAVIDGHLDWYDTSQAVFFNLRRVQVGDPIRVQRLDGSTREFAVTGVKTVAYNADPNVLGLFQLGGPPRLSLITCGGTWSRALNQYVSRVIVDAKLVSPTG